MDLALLLGLAWAAFLSVPLVARARRVATAQHALALGGPHSRTVARRADRGARVRTLLRRSTDRCRVSMAVRVLAVPVARRRAARVDAALARELPVAVDLLGVAVGAGCTPILAVEAAASWAPPVMARELGTVVRSCALGATFTAAIEDLAHRRPRLAALADALLVAERSGAPVAAALARLAGEERAALRRRAEAHARRVPVRLLFPLVFLVLPAFVLLTVVPGLAAGMARL
jgi:tight adherence protein C